jgi:hypothetical protein
VLGTLSQALFLLLGFFNSCLCTDEPSVAAGTWGQKKRAHFPGVEGICPVLNLPTTYTIRPLSFDCLGTQPCWTIAAFLSFLFLLLWAGCHRGEVTRRDAGGSAKPPREEGPRVSRGIRKVSPLRACGSFTSELNPPPPPLVKPQHPLHVRKHWLEGPLFLVIRLYLFYILYIYFISIFFF